MWKCAFAAPKVRDDRTTTLAAKPLPAVVGRCRLTCYPLASSRAARTRGARLKFMNARVEHLLNEVLGLPVEERSALGVALPDSLKTADESTVSELWRAEVNRCRAELRAG